jgi:hypothetical protein
VIVSVNFFLLCKVELYKILSQIHPFGGTNMYDGLKMGIDMLLSPPKPSGNERRPRTKRLILLSDEFANVQLVEGTISGPAAHLEGITISSVWYVFACIVSTLFVLLLIFFF